MRLDVNPLGHGGHQTAATEVGLRDTHRRLPA
jgi:hypothetical protein